jgi:L-asparagine permease
VTLIEEPHHHSLHAEQVGYKQTLGRRHVQMIAIGGAIGTGLFLGSASRLHSTGPALLFSYAFVGAIAFLLMRALGELVLHRPTSGAFVSYMREFYGEKWAYVTGWMYWLNWALTGIAELSAVGLYIQYWFPLMPTWATVLIALAVVLAVNLLSARAFGEFEFWAAIAKVAAIVVFLVVGTIIVVGGFSIGGHEAGFHNLWSNPGGFWPASGDYSWYGPILVMSGVVFLAVGLVIVVGGFSIGGHEAGFHNLWSNPGGFWPASGDYSWYGPILVMSGVVFAYAAIEMVGVAAGEMANPTREVPKAVNAVIFRIGIFYCGSILLLVCMLPTTEYKSGTSPFVTVFDRLGLTWMSTLIQIVLIVAAMSSLNAGLYSTGRVLRSLGMSKQAPAFTLKMSASGVPWAGIVMTSVVFIFGAVLNALVPDAFEIALEAAAIGVVFTWATIFLCQLRLRALVKRGVVPASPFPMPGHPYTSIIGLVFLGLVIVGLAVSGWESSPYFSHKVSFLVVVFGIPILTVALWLGWRLVKPAVVANTNGRIKAVWSNDGPTYGPGIDPDDLDPAKPSGEGN